MNKGLIFVLGLGIGGAAGFIADHIYMSKKLKKAQEDMEAHNEALVNYYENRDIYKANMEVIKSTSENIEVNPVDQAPDPETRKQMLIRNHEETAKIAKTQYDKMYEKKTFMDKMEELEENQNLDGYMSEDEILEEEMRQMNEERAENYDRGLEFSIDQPDTPSYMEDTAMTYYVDSDVLVDEDAREVVEEYHDILGGGIEWYLEMEENDASRDEGSTLYVINYDLDTLYVVEIVHGAYEE